MVLPKEGLSGGGREIITTPLIWGNWSSSISVAAEAAAAEEEDEEKGKRWMKNV